MILEKDKVYKIRHNTFVAVSGWNNYIIFSPINDIEIPSEFIYYIRDIKTHFTVCFDKRIYTRYDSRESETGIDNRCDILDLEDKDYPFIMEAIIKMGHGYKYNRKLNKIFQTI